MNEPKTTAKPPIVAENYPQKPGGELSHAIDVKESVPPQAVPAPPAFDPVVRRQAEAWVAAGLIGDSVLSDTRAGGYRRVQAFMLPPLVDPKAFRYWHVEDLIETAIACLERFSTLRSDWRDKLSKSFYVESEVIQYLANERTYAAEVASGLYETPAVEATQQAASAEKELAGAEAAEAVAKDIYDVVYSSSEMTRQKEFSSTLSWLGALPTYSADDKGTMKSYKINDSSGHREGTKPGFATDASEAIAAFQMRVGDRSSKLDYVRQQGATASARENLVGAKKRRDWEVANQTFRRQRTDAARQAAEQKLAAYTMPGGALNYREQMAGIALRMSREAAEALDRISVAADGLRLIYGRDEALPADVAVAIETRACSHLAIDVATVWVRDAQAWLARFKQLDQSFVLPLSLRSTLGEERWTQGKALGVWTFELVGSQMPERAANVRLRGLRGHVYGCSRDAGYWRAEVRLPTQSSTRHLSNQRVPLDQSLLPPIYLPRTGSRGDGAEVEFVGISAAFNASPYGTWTVHVEPLSSQRQSLAVVEDIEIDLAITLRTMPTVL